MPLHYNKGSIRQHALGRSRSWQLEQTRRVGYTRRGSEITEQTNLARGRPETPATTFRTKCVKTSYAYDCNFIVCYLVHFSGCGAQPHPASAPDLRHSA